MNDEKQTPQPDDLSRRIRAMDRPVPNPEYRERVQQQFLKAAFPEVALPGADFDTETVSAAPSLRSATSRAGLLWSGAGIAAAAALIFIVLAISNGPSWQVLQSTASGTVTINGQVVPVEDVVGTRLDPGTHLIGGETGELTLSIPGMITLILGPKADITLDSHRDGLRPFSFIARVNEGSTWGTTGERFPLGGLRVETRQAEVTVTGTTFSVMANDEYTCVCVLEGVVQARDLATGETSTIPADNQLFVYGNQTAALLVELTEDQSLRLEALRRFGAPSR